MPTERQPSPPLPVAPSLLPGLNTQIQSEIVSNPTADPSSSGHGNIPWDPDGFVVYRGTDKVGSFWKSQQLLSLWAVGGQLWLVSVVRFGRVKTSSKARWVCSPLKPNSCLSLLLPAGYCNSSQFVRSWRSSWNPTCIPFLILTAA